MARKQEPGSLIFTRSSLTQKPQNHTMPSVRHGTERTPNSNYDKNWSSLNTLKELPLLRKRKTRSRGSKPKQVTSLPISKNRFTALDSDTQHSARDQSRPAGRNPPLNEEAVPRNSQEQKKKSRNRTHNEEPPL